MFKFTGIAEEVEWKPTDIGGCILWLRSDLGITKDGSNIVSRWADQTENANDFVPAPSNTGPTWVTNRLNGHPSISFNGTTDFLYHLGLDLIQPIDIYMVMKQKAWTHGASPFGFFWYFDDAGNNPNQMGIRMSQVTNSPSLEIDSSKPYDGVFECSTLNQLLLDTWGVVQALFNGASSLTRINGGSPNTGGVDPVIGTSARGWGIGGIYRDWGIFGTKEGVDLLQMELPEIIIYNSTLSSPNRQRLELYFNTEAQGNGYAIY